VTPSGIEPATFRLAADDLYLHLYQRQTHIFTNLLPHQTITLQNKNYVVQSILPFKDITVSVCFKDPVRTAQ